MDSSIEKLNKRLDELPQFYQQRGDARAKVLSSRVTEARRTSTHSEGNTSKV